MKSILTINDTLSNKISFYHLVLFLVALPFDQFYSQLVLASFIIHTLIHLKKGQINQLFKKEVFILTSVFLVTLLCSIYTFNQKEAFSLLSRQFAILLFPVFLFLNPMDLRKYSEPILLIFAFACTIVICYLYIDAIRIIRYYNLPLSSLLSANFLNHNFSEPIGIHATYLSLYIALSIIVFVHQLLSGKFRSLRIAYILSSIILFAGLVQLGSRATLIGLLLMLGIGIPLSLKGRIRTYFLSVFILLMLIVSALCVTVDSYRIRFFNELKEDLSEKSYTNSATDSRMKRWDVALELVKKSQVIGYGSGDEVDLLKEQYFSHKYYDAYLNNLNAHNQYISFLLMGGIFALAIYLFTLGFGLRLAIKQHNTVFIGFMILLLIVSLSENILFRNKGIFFYSFFFSFFVCGELQRKRSNAANAYA